LTKRGSKWGPKVEEALRKKSMSLTELSREIGASNQQTIRGLRDLGDGKVGKAEPGYYLRTPETLFHELKQNQKTVMGEYTALHMPEALYAFVAPYFARYSDLIPSLEIYEKLKSSDELAPAESVGYHLMEASHALSLFISDQVQKKVVESLSRTERQLFVDYVDSLREGVELVAQGRLGRKFEGARKIADRVSAETEIQIATMGADEVVLEVLAKPVVGAEFEEGLKRRIRDIDAERFNLFVKGFLNIFNDGISLVQPRGRDRFIDLLGSLGALPRVNLFFEEQLARYARVILTETERRRRDLDSSLMPRLKKAFEHYPVYAGLVEQKTRWSWS
jgi:hypothetical protein